MSAARGWCAHGHPRCSHGWCVLLCDTCPPAGRRQSATPPLLRVLVGRMHGGEHVAWVPGSAGPDGPDLTRVGRTPGAALAALVPGLAAVAWRAIGEGRPPSSGARPSAAGPGLDGRPAEIVVLYLGPRAAHPYVARPAGSPEASETGATVEAALLALARAADIRHAELCAGRMPA